MTKESVVKAQRKAHEIERQLEHLNRELEVYERLQQWETADKIDRYIESLQDKQQQILKVLVA